MSFLKGYENQKRLVYIMLFILVAIPYFKPIGLPVAINDYTRDFYDTLVEMPEGSTILVHYGFEAGAWGELESQCVSVAQHLMKLPVKVIFCSTWGMGPPFIERTFDYIDVGSKVYGEDYINIGYIPGWETGVAALANDFHSIVSVDYFGDSIDGTFLDDVNDGSDIDLVIAFECGSAGSGTFRQQYQVPFGTPVLSGAIGVIVPGVVPFYNSGHISGILASVRGGAEYEILTNNPGKGVVGTDVLTFAHVGVIIAVIIGNIIYFRERGK